MLNSQSISQFYENFVKVPNKNNLRICHCMYLPFIFLIFSTYCIWCIYFIWLLYIILHCANILTLIFRPSFSEKFNTNVKIAKDSNFYDMFLLLSCKKAIFFTIINVNKFGTADFSRRNLKLIIKHFPLL